MKLRKVNTLGLACLLCTILRTMPMERPLILSTIAEQSSEISAAEEPDLQIQSAQIASSPALVSSVEDYLNSQKYFWGHVIDRLHKCPHELLGVLIEIAFSIEKQKLIANSAPTPVAARPVEQAEWADQKAYFWNYVISRIEHCPSEILTILISKVLMLQELFHQSPPALTQDIQAAEQRPSTPKSSLTRKKDPGHSSNKLKKGQSKKIKYKWKIDKGGIRRFTQKNRESIRKVLLTSPPVGNSTWTPEFLHAALKKECLHFEPQKLADFLKKEQDIKDQGSANSGSD